MSGRIRLVLMKDLRWPAFVSEILVALMVVAGCNKATGPIFQPIDPKPQDRAIIYIYRFLERGGDRTSPAYDVHVDGRKIGKLDDGGYFVYLAEPGHLTLSLDDKYQDEPVKLDLQGGETYYIALYFEIHSKEGKWVPPPYGPFGFLIAPFFSPVTIYHHSYIPHLRLIKNTGEALRQLEHCRRMQP